MSPYIQGDKQSIYTIINDAKNSLEKLKSKEDSLKFALVAYRDHVPQDNTFITKICDFTSSDVAVKFLEELEAQGGGDQAEAVMDGLNDGIFNVKWKEKSEKLMFLVLDSPPHANNLVLTQMDFQKDVPAEIQK